MLCTSIVTDSRLMSSSRQPVERGPQHPPWTDEETEAPRRPSHLPQACGVGSPGVWISWNPFPWDTTAMARPSRSRLGPGPAPRARDEAGSPEKAGPGEALQPVHSKCSINSDSKCCWRLGPGDRRLFPSRAEEECQKPSLWDWRLSRCWGCCLPPQVTR